MIRLFLGGRHIFQTWLIVPEKEPPKTVWNAINNDINPVSNSEKQSSGLFSSLMFWKTWSVLATGASFVLALMLLAPQPIQQTVFDRNLDHVALVGDQAEPLWVIGANLETGELTARAINASAAGLDKAFELWMLPTEGSPQSIGLLPVNGGRTSHQLPAALLALLKDSKGLAISIEPSGGSPTGLPTGPVIQTAKIIGL